MHYVYLVRCADSTLYCGWTTDLEKRVRAHNSGKGAKYTRSRRPVKLVYAEEFAEKQEALSREWHLKRLSREEKIRLIEKAGLKRNEAGM
jgi:putative endonuclease